MDIKPYRKKKISAPIDPLKQSKKIANKEAQPQADQVNKPHTEKKVNKKLSVKLLLRKKIKKENGIIIASIGFVLFISTILLYRIKSLPQLNFFDLPAFLGVNSFSKLGDNILFLPQKLVDYFLFKISPESFTTYRVVSVIFSIVVLALFFVLIKKILSTRDAILSSFLLGTSTWFITQSRMSTFEDMLFLSVVVTLLLYFVLNKSLTMRWLLTIFLSFSLLLYVPGFIWLFLGLIIFKHKSFINIFIKNDLTKNISLFSVFFLPLIPLVYFLILNGSLFKSWLGLTYFENINLTNFISNLTSLPGQLILTGPDNNLVWMYNSPILDAVTLLFIGCGIITFFIQESISRKFKGLLVYCVVISILLIAISGPVYINMLIIPAYIFLAFGINYLLNLWNSVFPFNPLAKFVALASMSVLIGLVGYYHIFRYYQAWPKNEATKAAYSQVISGTIDKEQYNGFYLR